MEQAPSEVIVILNAPFPSLDLDWLVVRFRMHMYIIECSLQTKRINRSISEMKMVDLWRTVRNMLKVLSCSTYCKSEAESKTGWGSRTRSWCRLFSHFVGPGAGSPYVRPTTAATEPTFFSICWTDETRKTNKDHDDDDDDDGWFWCACCLLLLLAAASSSSAWCCRWSWCVKVFKILIKKLDFYG